MLSVLTEQTLAFFSDYHVTIECLKVYQKGSLEQYSNLFFLELDS